MVDNAQQKKEADEHIKKLQGKIAKLKKDKTADDNKPAGDDSDCEAKLEKLRKEIVTLHNDLEKSNDKNKQHEKDITDLRGQLDKSKGLQGTVTRLQSELRTVHEQRRKHEDSVADLTERLRQATYRENVVKNQLRDGDAQHEATIAALQDRLKKAEKKTEKDAGKGAKDGEGSKGKSSGSESGSPDFSEWDTAKILREIKDAKEADGNLSDATEALLKRWTAAIADHNDLRAFNHAVDEIRDAHSALQQQVLSVYKELGFKGKDVDATKALDEIFKHLKDQPSDQVNLKLYALMQTQENTLERMRTRTERMAAQNLQMQLDMVTPSETVQKEIQMKYGMHDNREVEKRTDGRTTMYRNQRRGILDNLFGASNTLHQIGLRCPDARTRDEIRGVREKFLDPTTIPKPNLEKPRHAR
ncbi:hypothetical protein F4677DRAFT_431186, partial [Hypoxylon crocopeplum]